MSWSFSNSAVTRVCMYKFSALYLQWFQSYGQQFIWLLDVDCLADKERLKLLLSGEGSFILPPFTQFVPPPHKLCCSSFGDLNSNFLKIKMTYSSKNLSRYMIQKEKKKIKTEVGWNFCQLMKTLDFWALCREIPFWWLLPMCKFFVFSGICVSVSVYICSTLNCHAVPANADESVSVSLAQRDDPKQ